MTGTETISRKLWLDDVRRPPADDWAWALSVDAAVEILETGTVAEASLDNDLYPFERDGLEVVEWMIDHEVFPRLMSVHTDNRYASRWMCGLLERSGYRGVPGQPRHFIRKNGTRMSPRGFKPPHPRSTGKRR